MNTENPTDESPLSDPPALRLPPPGSIPARQLDAPNPPPLSLLVVASGVFLAAASFNLFLNPNHIAAGGITGLSTILLRTLHLEPYWTQAIINLPLFVLITALFGRRFGLKTAFGALLLPLFVGLTRHWTPPTHNLLLASLYGGIGVGVGVGLVFREGGSMGGFTLAAYPIQRFTGLSLGAAMMTLDGLVVIGAGFVFGPEQALYGLISMYVTRRTVDRVQTGLTLCKIVLIISEKTDAIREAVLFDLKRGLTRLPALGGYTEDERTILLVVVHYTEVAQLKAIVRAIDPGAFVVLTEANEVLGQGFKAHE